MVGTIPPKKIEEVIGTNSPTKKSEEFNKYQSIKYKEISIINDSGIKLSKYQLLSIKEIMYQSINLRSIKVSSIKYKKVSSI